MKAQTHLGLAKAHVNVPANCQAALALAPEDRKITEQAYITWGNALASEDYLYNNIQALLKYHMVKNVARFPVAKRYRFIAMDLRMYDSYCAFGATKFRMANPNFSDDKINQLQLTAEDAAQLVKARKFFNFE